MPEPSADEALPSVDELLAATDWAGRVAEARARRAAALGARVPRPALPETKPWDAEDYVALLEPPRPARVTRPALLPTGTPVLTPQPRRRHPVLVMAAAGFLVGGVLSPVIAERVALWLSAPERTGAEVAGARPGTRAAAAPVAPGARQAGAAAEAGQGLIRALEEPRAAALAVPDAPPPAVTGGDAPDAAGVARPAVGGMAGIGDTPLSLSPPDSVDIAGPAVSARPDPVAVAAGGGGLPVMPASGHAPSAEPGPVRPVVLAEGPVPGAAGRETSPPVAPAALPEPRGVPAAPPTDASEARTRLLLFLPDGEEAAAAEVLRAALTEAGFATGEPGSVNLRVSRTHVRVYHAADRARAAAVAAAVGGEARDFTGFRPLPPPGTIEVWIAGSPRPAPLAADRGEEPTARSPVRRFITAIMPDGRRERLRVVEDGGGVVARTARLARDPTDGGSAMRGRGDPVQAGAADGGGGPSAGPGRAERGGGGAPREAGRPDRGRSEGGPGNGQGRGGGQGGGRGNGNGKGGRD